VAARTVVHTRRNTARRVMTVFIVREGWLDMDDLQQVRGSANAAENAASVAVPLVPSKLQAAARSARAGIRVL
ncbi:MAG: hypothetical protein ACKOB6_04140, partial [Candidatus Kapaibacterium sp.]